MVSSSVLYEALLVQPGETEAALVSHSLPGDSFRCSSLWIQEMPSMFAQTLRRFCRAVGHPGHILFDIYSSFFFPEVCPFPRTLQLLRLRLCCSSSSRRAEAGLRDVNGIQHKVTDATSNRRLQRSCVFHDSSLSHSFSLLLDSKGPHCF